MKRILLMVFRNILIVPFMWIKLCYMAARPDKFTEEQHRKMLWFITERANKGGNVIIDAHGLENIPKENGFIMFFGKFNKKIIFIEKNLYFYG